LRVGEHIACGFKLDFERGYALANFINREAHSGLPFHLKPSPHLTVIAP
jgi:hypothetical protein